MQLELFRADQAALLAALEAQTGMRIDLTITDNTSSLMAFHTDPRSNRARLRIHHMFLNADPQVVRALGTWLTHRQHKRSASVLDAFIQGHEHLIRRGQRSERMCTIGTHHDLNQYYDEVNAGEFDGTVTCPITWGRASSRRRMRSIRLGSYSPEDDLIRIHPNLDRTFVPDYFVRYVVFHEMLHAHLGVEYSPTGRRRIHTPEFKCRERAYHEFDRAMAWHDGEGNLARVMRNPSKKRLRA